MDRIRFLWAWMLDAMRGALAGVGPAFARLGPWAVAAWAWAVRMADRMRKSVVALVSSPAVWMAVIAVFFGAFILGFGTGAQGKRELRSDLVDARRGQEAANARADLTAANNRKLLAEISTLKGRVEALQAELRQAPKSVPVTAKRRRPATRALNQADAAPARFWWPWQ